MGERAFVRAPLAERAPEVKGPTGETVGELAARLGREQEVHASVQL